jgi:hypothetical protein
LPTDAAVVNPRLHLWSNASETASGFLKGFAYQGPHNNKKRGGVVTIQDNPVPELQGFRIPEQQGFTTEDILWAVGIWSVILCLSPVILFYMLMVA